VQSNTTAPCSIHLVSTGEGTIEDEADTSVPPDYQSGEVSMLEGVQVETESIIEVQNARLQILQRENIMMEAALNDAHRELDRLRTLVPTDTEVKEDDYQPNSNSD